MTIGEFSDYLNNTEQTIYRLSQAKRIPPFKVGGMWRYSRVDIDQWIARKSSGKVEGNN